MSALAAVPPLARALLLATAIAVFASPVLAQAPAAPDEAKVKAAFLLRFGQFVAWPQEALAGPGAALVIGVAGADAIAAELSQQSAATRAALGRPVTVRAVKSPDDASTIHLLFVGAEESARIAQYAAVASGRHMLLVTESPGALEQGSMINFVIADRRVKFEIALARAEKAGLALSSRLLAVAMRVLKGELRADGYRVARVKARLYR
jgi:hypothetical protein